MLKSRIVNIFFLVLLVALILVSRVYPLPWFAFAILIVSYLCIHAYGSSVLSAEFFLPVKHKGHPQSDAIALTFDDGPIPGRTERILDILRTHNVRAAFFCIGHRVVANPALVKRIHEAGHIVGNHSYWHGKMFDLQTPAKISKELMDTDRAIADATGMTPNFFRPPYGVTNPMVARAVRRHGHTTVGWSIRSFDTVIRNPVSLMSRVTKTLGGGDIVLFHDFSATTLDILPSFLDQVAKRGLRVVRVDELLNEKAYA